MNTAFVFPGQGSQSLGMMQAWAENSVVRQTYVEAADTLGVDFWTMSALDGDAHLINSTIHTQPLMLTAAVATYRAWSAAGGAVPKLLAGHSLGEYSALVVAGVLPFVEALRLVRLRAELMQAAVPEGAGAMAAILGLENSLLSQVCVEQAQGQVLEAVNYNAIGQTVIAGDAAAVARGIEACKAAGAKRVLLLPVSVPSHCALMRGAAALFAEALPALTWASPQIAVLQNADVQAYTEVSAIQDALVRQLYQPVRWVETVQALIAQGVTQLVECAPGKVLAGLNKRIDSQVPTATLIDPASVAALLAVYKF
jgi:[acyl-carrier-protein] S-malonyltransferase